MNFFAPTNTKRTAFFIISDILIFFISIYIAFLLRFDFTIQQTYLTDIYKYFILVSFTRIPLFFYFNIYSVSWRYFSFKDNIYIVYILLLSIILNSIFVFLFRDIFFSGFPRSIILIEYFISLVLVSALRVGKRAFLELFNRGALGIPSLIIATDKKANEIIRTIKINNKYWPVAILNTGKMNNIKINGVFIRDKEYIQKIHNGIDTAIISDEFDTKMIYDEIKKLNIKNIKIYNSFDSTNNKIKEISVEDLLARNPKDLDKHSIAEFINNKTILITGAGGSIGSEISRQCAMYGAKELILLDHSEFNLYNITEELKDKNIVPILQSVVHKEDIENTFKKYKIDIVIHAAAYKHVPLVEENIHEAIINNIIGTKNIIDVSCKYNVEKFVLISTDKAVRPTNVMGATKRVCELYAQNVPTQHTDIVAVRFGNVLGSSGSVIPKFKEQIEHGGPVTVTHPDITRYFMLIPEACELVLQAASMGKGGEIYILDMGEPIKIVDLAKKMIELSGKENIKIKFTGLRPGEKLYEELLLDESDKETQYSSIFIAKPTYYDYQQLVKDIQKLITSDNKIKILKKIVPEFSHK